MRSPCRQLKHGWRTRGKAGAAARFLGRLPGLCQNGSGCPFRSRRRQTGRIYLAGHSWGSMVGILTVARHPEDYIAYIRISQAVLLAESERISYDWALETAKARNNRKAIAELERIGPPLNGRYGGGVAAQKRQRRWVQKFGGAVYGGSIHTLARVLLSSRAYSLFDKIRWFRGGRFSLRHLWTPENIGVDLFACVPELSVPVYILQGRYDYQTAFATAERYAQRLRAPLKRFIPFECSAHTVPFDEPQRFRQILLEVVLQETLPAGN